MLSLSRKKRVPATLSTLERQEHNKKVKLAAEKILNMESLAAGPSESNVDKYKPPESQANDAMNKSEINLTKTLEREDVGAAPLEETIASKYKLPPLKSSHKNTATSKNNKKGSSREKSKVKPVEAMEEDEEEDSIVLSSSQYFTSKKKEKSLKFAKNSKNESSINDDIIDISSSQESTIEPQITSKVMNKEDEKEVQTKQDQQVQEMKEAPMKENLMEEDLEEEGLMEEDLKEEDLKEEGLKEEGSKDDLEPTTKQVDHATPPEEKVAPKSTKRQRFRPAIPDPKYHAHKTDEKPTKEEERGQDGGKEKTTAPEIIDVEALTEYAYSHNKYLMNYKPLRNMIIVSSEDENGPPPPQKKLRLSLRKK
jgi:hypothetical protein